MDTSYIEEVRLTSFKSFKDQVLPLDELTLLVGRNGSGKSNALDGLWTLARLATGEDIRDALDGGREGPAVRGGSAGCAPFGQWRFSLGCTVRTGQDQVRLDLTIQTAPEAHVVAESLAAGDDTLLSTSPPQPGSGNIHAEWGAGKQLVSFQSSRLLATQVLSRVPATTEGRRVHLAAAQVISALRAVFVLDPVPHVMRGYVPERDVLLRRDAENLSAAVADLLADPDTAERLRDGISKLNEQKIKSISSTRSDLGDVMLMLIEPRAGHTRPVPATLMSDGSLRFLAILVALLQAPTGDPVPERLASEDAAGQTTLVVEELENGLHASQASHLIGLVRDEVHRRRVRAIATTHSPTLLDALTKKEHRSVVVCQRNESGASVLRRLASVPNYTDIIVGGGLGRAAERDALRAVERQFRRPSEVLAEALGQ